MTRSPCNLPIGEPWPVPVVGSLSAPAAAVRACVMILLYDMLLARASLSRRSSLWSPIVSTSAVPFRFAGTKLPLHSMPPATGKSMRIRMRMRARAGLRGRACRFCYPYFWFWGLLIFHLLDGSAARVCIKYKTPVLLQGAWDRRSGSTGLQFPFISTRYSARCHLVDGISPPHNLERATSLPRVGQGIVEPPTPRPHS